MANAIAVYGPLEAAEASTVRAAAATLGAEALFFQEPAALAARLEQGLPSAVLVASGCDGAVEVVTHLRDNVRFAALPVVGLSSDRTDLSFGELYAQGGDDLASARSLRGLVARLRGLMPASGAPREPRGTAVVAGTGLRWRSVMGRTLANAGIVPRFVNNVADAVEQACAADVRFVVASDDLPPDGATAALEQARAKGSRIPWVAVASTRRVPALAVALKGIAGAAVVDAYAPPDHVLFMANDLSRPDLAERRSSSRLPFGTTVSFRTAGGAEDDVGFTYNIAAAGLFVRTLAPLAPGSDVWLELWPPRSERAVRLTGRVAWRRAYGPTENATVPPGFGVQLTGGLPGDLEHWEEAYWALVEAPAVMYSNAVWGRLSAVPPSLAASTVA